MRRAGLRGEASVRASACRRIAAVLGVLGLLGVVAPRGARADRRELYTLVGYQPGVSRFRSPAGGDAAVTSFAGAFDLWA
jgi:hypothetical protein